MSIKDLKMEPITPPKKQKVSLEGVVGSKVSRDDYGRNGHWFFEDAMGASDKIGFIYVVRNSLTGRSYIGKKQYRGRGKLNKGEESNWKWYITSSKELSDDIKASFKENFEFICLEEYSSAGALSWAETWSLCFVEAPSNQTKWYNRLIQKVSWTVKEPITSRHREKLIGLLGIAGKPS